ncbi:ark1 [Symbiodinium necroappetens]|uniref:Ark1 protein n=1 Tax=Symbiodinium necroappetens TaxID=1628268 RepID=A0A812KM66_9DINO|nr:ark1 [Symbiodinium necroappetens]
MGSVKKVMHKTSGHVFALKAVDQKLVLDHNLQHQLIAEVETQKTLSHPNLLRCFDYFTERDTVYILLELASGGDLYQHLRRRGPMREPQAAHVFRQVCEGVRHLHDQGIIHRDLKPENILLTEDMTVKIADFGWAAKAARNDTRKTFCGTLCMLAPEMIAGKEYDARVDVWAVGVLLFEILTGCSPFDRGQGLMETCKAIVGPGLHAVSLDEVPPPVHPILFGLMQQEAENRMSLDECLQNDWVVAQCKLYAKDVLAAARSKETFIALHSSEKRMPPEIAESADPPKEFSASQPLENSRLAGSPKSESRGGSSPFKQSSTSSTATPSSTAAAAFAMTDAEISPVSPGVFPRGSSASRGLDACSASSSRIINVKAVEEDTPVWERESVSSVASLRSEGKWRLEEGKELLRKVEIETPRAQLKTPQVGSQSDQMHPPGTRLDLIPPRTCVLATAALPTEGPGPLPAHGFLPEVAQSDASDSSDEMPEGEVAFGAAFDSSGSPSRKRWSQERLKSLDDPVSPVKHSGSEAYDRQAGGYDRPLPRVLRPDRGPAAKAVARSSASSHSSSDGHSGSQQGSSAAHSSTSKASNGLVRKLTEQLGYSWHQAIEAAKRTSSVEAAVEWLEEKEGANNATRWGQN